MARLAFPDVAARQSVRRASGHASGRVPATREFVMPKKPFIVPHRLQRNAHSSLARLSRPRRWPESSLALTRRDGRCEVGLGKVENYEHEHQKQRGVPAH